MFFFWETDATDYTQLWNDLRQEISLVIGPKSALPGQGSFGHITGGYDAGAFRFTKLFILATSDGGLTNCLAGKKIGYYGYMYSLVFAADMYATVFKKDPLNPTLGEKYKNSILLPGGSREELDSLTVRCDAIALLHEFVTRSGLTCKSLMQEFLGRPPNAEAFMKELFGDSKTSSASL